MSHMRPPASFHNENETNKSMLLWSDKKKLCVIMPDASLKKEM